MQVNDIYGVGHTTIHTRFISFACTVLTHVYPYYYDAAYIATDKTASQPYMLMFDL